MTKIYREESFSKGKEFTEKAEQVVSETLNIPVVEKSIFNELNVFPVSTLTDVGNKEWVITRDITNIAVKEAPYRKFDGVEVDGKPVSGFADMVISLPNAKIRVEVRYQNTSGTASEKHGHFVVQSMMSNEFTHHIMVAGGDYLFKDNNHKGYKKCTEVIPGLDNVFILDGVSEFADKLKEIAGIKEEDSGEGLAYMCNTANNS